MIEKAISYAEEKMQKCEEIHKAHTEHTQSISLLAMHSAYKDMKIYLEGLKEEVKEGKEPVLRDVLEVGITHWINRKQGATLKSVIDETVKSLEEEEKQPVKEKHDNLWFEHYK